MNLPQRLATPTSPRRGQQLADGAGGGAREPDVGRRRDANRRRPSKLGRGRRNDGSLEPSRGLTRGVSAAMLKEGARIPSPGLFERGPQTPDYQQQSAQEQPEAREVLVPPEAPRIRKWHVNREEAVAEACGLLGIGSGGSSSSSTSTSSKPTEIFFEQPRMVGLSGPCGSGKSTVASMIIAREDVRKFFHRGVLWLQVGQGVKDHLPELTLHLARMVYETVMLKACRPPRISGVGVDPEDGAAYIQEVVGESNMRFLVVADNVWEAEVLKELRWAGVWVLYTTRHEDLLPKTPLVQLDHLREREAELVLRRAADLGDGTAAADPPLPPAARELMSICEFSAMHLAFAGRWGVVRGRGDEEAWRAAVDHIREARKAGGGGDGGGGGEEGPLLPWRDAMLRAGPGELESADAPENKELYLSLALLPKGLAFRASVAAVLLFGDDRSPEKQKAAGAVLATLERLSILTLEVGGKYRVHEVHADFLWDYCVTTCTAARDRALPRWREYVSSVRALSTYSSVWLAKIWEVLAAVEGGGAVERPYDAALDAMDPSSPLLSKALRRAARFHWRRQDRLEAYTKQYQLRLIEASQVDPEGVAMANILHVLGMCVYKAGRKEEAEGMYRRALAIFEEKLGPGDLEVAHTLYELGRCLYKAGRTEEAEGHLRRALAIEEEKLGPHHPDVASTNYHLGVCLCNAGRREEAKVSLRQSLAIWEGHPEGDSLNVAHALHSLGLCSLRTGDTGAAEGLLRRSLEIREGLGSSHADVASTLHHLGACASKAGRAEEAERLYRRALAIREERLGADHPDLAHTLHDLGVCVGEAGRPGDEARGLLERALSIKQESLGADHPSVAKTRRAMKGCAGGAAGPRLSRLTVPALLAGGLLGATLLIKSGRKGRP